ncbi:MAG: MBL fold metallo-hydrolase [Chitinophagaceae bacterium]
MLNIHAFTFSPIQENTYLLWNDDKEAIIIDPGCYHSYEEEELKSFIEGKGLKPVLLLNTHCHLDHVFGEKYVAATWNLVPHIHPNEQQVLRFAEASGKMWNMPFENYTGPMEFLKEGDIIKLGADELNVLFAPGHSPGHVCFYVPAQNFLIGGDVLFQGSIGRTDLPGGNFDVLMESIQTQLMTLPDNTRVYSGHGPATTIGAERKTNPYLMRYGS